MWRIKSEEVGEGGRESRDHDRGLRPVTRKGEGRTGEREPQPAMPFEAEAAC